MIRRQILLGFRFLSRNTRHKMLQSFIEGLEEVRHVSRDRSGTPRDRTRAASAQMALEERDDLQHPHEDV